MTEPELPVRPGTHGTPRVLVYLANPWSWVAVSADDSLVAGATLTGRAPVGAAGTLTRTGCGCMAAIATSRCGSRFLITRSSGSIMRHRSGSGPAERSESIPAPPGRSWSQRSPGSTQSEILAPGRAHRCLALARVALECSARSRSTPGRGSLPRGRADPLAWVGRVEQRPAGGERVQLDRSAVGGSVPTLRRRRAGPVRGDRRSGPLGVAVADRVCAHSGFEGRAAIPRTARKTRNQELVREVNARIADISAHM